MELTKAEKDFYLLWKEQTLLGENYRKQVFFEKDVSSLLILSEKLSFGKWLKERGKQNLFFSFLASSHSSYWLRGYNLEI